MVNPEQFNTLAELETSTWLTDIKSMMENDIWPRECVRCQTAESIGNKSIRQHALDDHPRNNIIRSDYILLGGVLDNICNSACYTCNENLSTKIGSLKSKNYIKINNSDRIDQLPLDRITRIDINGGEPSASPNYLKLLDQLPPNVKYLRLNTNGSRVITALPKLIERGVNITVTVSLDGIDRIHDYVRWPIKFKDVEQTINTYETIGVHELNTWTTVSALNIGDLKNIQAYTNENNIKHAWALLEQPEVLSIRHRNHFTITADVPDELIGVIASGADNSSEIENFINQQDDLRGIHYKDYYQ
jgi:sulfatase maturation enzyme AslB (radical SAM superfamily)